MDGHLVQAATLDSDHLPVSLKFEASTDSERLPTIPRWLLEDEHFRRFVRTRWKGGTGNAFECLDSFKQLLYDAKRSTFALSSTKRKLHHDQLTTLNYAFSLLRAISQYPTDYSRVSAILIREPEITDSLSGQVRPDGTFRTDRLRAFIDTILSDAVFEDTCFDDEDAPWIPPTKPKRSGGLASELKVLLPGCRTVLAGLRPAGLTSTPTTDPKLMAEIALPYYGALWREGGSHDADECKEYATEDDAARPTMDTPLPGVQDMVDTIMATSNTAAGPDGIPFGAYREFADLVGPLLHAVLTEMARGQLPPRGYNYAFLYLLPKKLTMLIQDTRPISVTNSDNRIVARCMVDAIIEQVKLRLHPAQKGSIRGYQGQDHIKELTEEFYKAVESPTDQYHVLFADTKKAFDSIHHRFIFAAMVRLGLPEWAINVVRGLLDKVAATPIFGTYTGMWISITRGVKQGCPSSPIIFAICLDVLIVRLGRVRHIRIWAYVDDIAIGCSKVRGFAACMRAMDAFSQASGLGLNRDKTSIVSAKDDPLTEIWLESKDCPWYKMGISTAMSYVYLGILIGRLITIYDIWNTVFNKLANRLAGYKHTLSQLTPYKRIEVFNIFVYPLVSYIGPLYALPCYNKKDKHTTIQYGHTTIKIKGPPCAGRGVPHLAADHFNV